MRFCRESLTLACFPAESQVSVRGSDGENGFRNIFVYGHRLVEVNPSHPGADCSAGAAVLTLLDLPPFVLRSIMSCCEPG